MQTKNGFTFALFSALLATAAAAWANTAPPVPYGPVPSPKQLAWQENELTMFCHFGMNTFTGRSIGTGQEDPNTFDPTDLDCDQWVSVAKACGFKGFILTCKHHDGFCLWPTKTTKHSVAYSKWEDGKGDVVRDCSDACRKGGILFGVYCSPYDLNAPSFTADPPAYSKMYRQQLTELLTGYGPVFEMWLDGNHAGSIVQFPQIIATIRKCQPNAIIKEGPPLRPVIEDIRWVGNERAIAPLTNWSVFPPPTAKGEAAGAIWFPDECDIPMVGSWFWNDKPPLSLDRLLDIYFKSEGRNSELLLNVAPDKEGKLSDDSVKRLYEFHDALAKIFGHDLAAGKPAVASNVRGGSVDFCPANAMDGRDSTYWATDDGVTSASLTVDLGKPTQFNMIGVKEEIALGQRVEQYEVDALEDGKWTQVSSGTTIGYRKLDRFPTVTATQVRLVIQKSLACPVISGFSVYDDTISPPESFQPANALQEVKPKHKGAA